MELSNELKITPTSIKDEAKALYPDDNEKMWSKYSHNAMLQAQRAAHITCAKIYLGEIEKLRGENERMRTALEWYANAGNYLGDNGDLATAWKMNENITNKATEALKTT